MNKLKILIYNIYNLIYKFKEVIFTSFTSEKATDLDPSIPKLF
jgi:hypothetical protein